ncbi:hypothetical protein LTR91_009121 [Friedmanniomyces endolithicus]|uniref:Uncharacterized protein n=1 Tax=Friedmanniomyces endolithicus TaxID=329885 RepID=A0AAN6KM01_9PEZI|nr:hypothetical protein LTR35_004848 [Friedmanniomyces endolithicus]KAK0299314.1 hypothetical protein LTS00_002425 [Friedmanniomyces endolithicus]KAK0304777.1 hypothetical protein LTR01_007276 [Friedmanniomyces endolithicus]KAK0310882.1 hypothetical protein LTR82_014629 [Friedmanniomyces endolithicus]KAK0824830.1 hypothetical protein LTR73_007383 [Friedmanniomyces endolithicus]
MVTVEAKGVGVAISIDSVHDVADERVFAAGAEVVEEDAAEIAILELALELRVVEGLALSALDELAPRLFDEVVLDAVDVAKVVELDVAADNVEFAVLDETALL